MKTRNSLIQTAALAILLVGFSASLLSYNPGDQRGRKDNVENSGHGNRWKRNVDAVKMDKFGKWGTDNGRQQRKAK